MVCLTDFSEKSLRIIAKFFEVDTSKPDWVKSDLAQYSETIETIFFEYSSFDSFMDDFYETFVEDYGFDNVENIDDLANITEIDDNFCVWVFDGIILVMDMID